MAVAKDWIAIQKRAKKIKLDKKKLLDEREWVDLRCVNSYANWALFFVLLGAREAGKSYSLMEYILRRKMKKKKGVKIFWLRLNDYSLNKMLTNNGAKFVDADLVLKYGLDISTRAGTVFDHKKPFIQCLTLSTAYSDKGSALYDNTYKGEVIVILDEFQLERNQKRTFDIAYNFVLQMENLARSQKSRIKVFLVGNSTEECSDILTAFNFIPQDFGIFKVKKKRAVIFNFAPNKAYKARRKGSIGDLLAGDTSNYTNQIKMDTSLITKKRLVRPSYIIKFSKDPKTWFTVWDGEVIAPYNGEKKIGIAMKRYIDESYTDSDRNDVFELFDTKSYKFKNLITQKRFTQELGLIKRQ